MKRKEQHEGEREFRIFGLLADSAFRRFVLPQCFVRAFACSRALRVIQIVMPARRCFPPASCAEIPAMAVPRASYFKSQISNTKFQIEQSRPAGNAVKRANVNRVQYSLWDSWSTISTRSRS